MATMARLRRKQKRKEFRIELLPVELQLDILTNLSSSEDLASLIIASRSYHATYLEYKKPILAAVAQATLGDLFVHACMLQHWQGNINSYAGEEDGGTDMLLHLQRYVTIHQLASADVDTRRAVGTTPWPRGPYRHIQLKFLHDYDKLALDDAEDQARHMRSLLTAEDFSQILSFHSRVIQPMSRLFTDSFSDRENETTIFGQSIDIYEVRSVSSTERQRIMQTLYRFQIFCQLYRQESKAVDNEIFVHLTQRHRLAAAISGDFFSRYDMLENHEFAFAYRALSFEVHKYSQVIRDRAWRYFLWNRPRWAGLGDQFFDDGPVTPDPASVTGLVANAVSNGLKMARHLVWEALMAQRESYHYNNDWPESWSDEFWGIEDES